ncbi:14841_t:CDS:2, partial [Funneliformis mosseae]
PNSHTIAQINNVIYDELQAVKNAIEDKCIVSGTEVFQVRLSTYLNKFKSLVKRKTKIGVQKEFAAKHIVGVDLNTENTLNLIVK